MTPWIKPDIPAEGKSIAFFGKGGSGKSTVAGHVLRKWHEDGIEAAGIDTDQPGQDEEGSLYTWDSAAPLGPVVRAHYNPTTLPREMRRNTPVGGLLLADTPAWANVPGGVHHSALAACDLAVFLIQPSEMDLNRGGSLLIALRYLEDIGANVPEVIFLLSRTHTFDPEFPSTREAREEIEDNGFEVMESIVPNRMGHDGYGRSFCTVPKVMPGDPMENVARDLAHRAAAIKEIR